MAGRHPKGTTDADADGKMGGSLPILLEPRVAALESMVEYLKAIMRANGWTVPDV